MNLNYKCNYLLSKYIKYMKNNFTVNRKMVKNLYKIYQYPTHALV